jgi:hypothetical protein
MLLTAARDEIIRDEFIRALQEGEGKVLPSEAARPLAERFDLPVDVVIIIATRDQ